MKEKLPDQKIETEQVIIKGDVFSKTKGIKVGEVKTEGNAFYGAEKCLCTKKVEAKEIGNRSLGVVILGQTEGKVFPSVILMEGKLKKENPEEIERFFEEELKRSQQGEESIFDYLCYFSWEGETTEEGKKNLKKRYDKIQNKKKLKKYYFYHLINNNSKREKIFLDFNKLKEETQKTLLVFNDYLLQFGEVKIDFSIFSIEQWLGLAEELRLKQNLRK